jgi:hypothetical protein
VGASGDAAVAAGAPSGMIDLGMRRETEYDVNVQGQLHIQS